MAAIVIDADNDGVCSGNDLIHEDLFYGWGVAFEDRPGDLEIDLNPLDVHTEFANWHTIDTALSASWHNPCATYFPTP